MDIYDAQRKRTFASGNTRPEGVMNSTKRQIREYILNSPSKSNVEVLQLVEKSEETFELETGETKMAIVSDKETFYKRTILFMPDEDVPMGTYFRYDKKIYLSTNISDVDGYPQSFVEYCNHTIRLYGKEIRIPDGKDSLGRPKYKTIKPEYNIPCISKTKIYSELNNSQMPLPEGAILIYIPYHEKVKIPVNHEFSIHSEHYKVTTVNPINVLTDENGEYYGYLEIRGQSEVAKA